MENDENSENDENGVSVISWNILADCYTDKANGAFAFIDPADKSEILGWSTRQPKIVDIVSSERYDIICLQEVDLSLSDSLIKAILKTGDYDYACHVNTIGLDVKKCDRRPNPIGNVTLWRADKFELIEDALGSCSVAVKLECIVTKQCFWLYNIHLRAGTINGAPTRMCQAKSLIKTINKNKKLGGSVCICGDFNDPLTTWVGDHYEGNELAETFSFAGLEPRLCPGWTCHTYGQNSHTHNYHTFDQVCSQMEAVIEFTPTPMEPIPNLAMPSDHLPVRFKLFV